MLHQFKLNESLYQIAIENGDIILQGMHEDIMFVGAWDEIYQHLEREYWTSDFCQVRGLTEFVEYEQDDRVETWLFYNKNVGVSIPHCVN